MERTIRTGQVRTVRLKTVRYAMAAFPLPIADSSQVSVLLLLLVSVAIGRKKFSISKLLTSAVKRTELMIKGERERKTRAISNSGTCCTAAAVALLTDIAFLYAEEEEEQCPAAISKARSTVDCGPKSNQASERARDSMALHLS